jgi:hypothetical protein
MIDRLMGFVGSTVIVGILCSQYTATAFSMPPSVAHRPDVTASTASQDKAQPEARRIWEQAVAAKGGRERLHTIQNILTVQRGDYKRQNFSLRTKYATPSKRSQVTSVSLDVFPNKFWDCEDYRPDVFGIIMHMYNYDTGMKYVLTLGEPNHPLEPIEPKEKRESRTFGLVAYLLETTWLRPIPIKASTAKIGQRKVDMVQTSLNGQRIDFALDLVTHLPVQVSFYSTFQDKTYVTTEKLSDYAEVNGIKVPLTTEMDDGTKYTATVQFNVEYNPEIFTRLPRFDLGLNAWRPTGP